MEAATPEAVALALPMAGHPCSEDKPSTFCEFPPPCFSRLSTERQQRIAEGAVGNKGGN